MIEAAQLPRSPSSPNYVTNAVLGLVLGLALGMGLAFLRERLDDRFRGRPDVEHVTGAPVLAVIPRFRPDKRSDSPALVTASRPKGITSEAYRSLRTNLLFITGTQKVKSILLTSAQVGEGKTVTCANLGLVLAQSGSRVILVSSDLRRPSLEQHLKVTRRDGGLSSWLASDGSPVWEHIQDPRIPNLRVLPGGPIPPNPTELLASPRFAELVAMLEDNADYVLYDSPPALAVTDASLISAQVGATIVIIDSGTTHRKATGHAASELRRVGANLVGCVLNSLDPSSSPYYYGPYLYDFADTEEAVAGDGATAAKPRRRLLGLRRR